MPRSGLVFDKKSKPLTKRILNFFEKVRYSYLSAKEDPKEYEDKWQESVKKIRSQFDGLDDFTREMKKYIDEDNLFDAQVMNPESNQAEKLYKSIRQMRFKSRRVSDPFADAIGEDKVVEKLMENDSLFVAFIHYAMRSHANVLPDKLLESHGFKADDITQGVLGLDLEPKDIPIYLSEHYGDDVDTKRLKSKFKNLFSKFKTMFNEQYDKDNWENLIELDINKSEDDDRLGFIIPNKPMYRIFEIDDLNELKGFTGEWVVQEKYDGMRIQIHKTNGEIKIYSYNEKDITDKCPDQVKAMKNKAFKNCIFDAELMLFKDDEALHRADTVKHVFKKETDGVLRAHVFDIMQHEDKNILDEPLRERINILFYQYSEHSDEALAFPSKKDTRIADSIKEVENYSKDIMALPTSEGVVIKDIESTYYRGTKKNPKWIKWKKFVDLDVIVLDKSKTKSNLYSYTMGIGPVSIEYAEENNTVEIEGENYIPVGKALNTKKNVQVGSIIRVKVDEVKKTKGKYSLYSAKLIEIPEVDSPDKLETLEQLSTKTKKSLAALPEVARDVGRAFRVTSGVKDAKKSYYITDNIHGSAEIILKQNLDGFTLYGFKGDKLMAKNALVDIDIWKEQVDKEIKKVREDFRNGIREFLLERQGAVTTMDRIMEWVGKQPELAQPFEQIFEGNPKELEKWLIAQSRHGILFDPKKKSFKADKNILMKDDTGKFRIIRKEDGNVDLVIDADKMRNVWSIRLDDTDDIYDLFGKSGKYPAIVGEYSDEGTILDEGKLVFGMQKHGYHEYKIMGDKFETRMHFRVVPVNEKRAWLAWTGKKQDMLDYKGDSDLQDISNDKYKDLPYPPEANR
jgi:hypothetical protein